jgi:hypothetical protein
MSLNLHGHDCVCCSIRDTSKAEYIASLGLDNVIYVPAAADAINVGKRCKRSDAFNQVLNKVYPKETVIKQCDLIMALDDDQVRSGQTLGRNSFEFAVDALP